MYTLLKGRPNYHNMGEKDLDCMDHYAISNFIWVEFKEHLIEGLCIWFTQS